MPELELPPAKSVTIAWVAISLVAVVGYFCGISHELIWYDEAVSVAIANHSFFEIFGLMPLENHPPLHFLILWLVRHLFGNSEWALRLPSAAAAVGMVALGAGPVRRLLGNRTAIIYACVVLFTPVVLIYAHEARMYSLCNLAVTATALHGVLAAKNGRTGDWVGFVLWSLAGAYLHYYGLIAAAMAHVFVLSFVLLGNRQQLRRSLFAAGLTCAAYSPWLFVLAGQAARVNKTGFWIPPVSAFAMLSALFKPFTYRELFPMPLPVIQPWMAAALGLSLILIVIGVALARRRQGNNELTLASMLLACYFGTAAVTILMSLVAVPIFYSRYFIVCTGMFALLTSLGIAQLRRKWLSVGAVVVFAALNSFTLKDVYTQYFNLPFKQVKETYENAIKPGDLIITSDCFSVGPAFHYFPRAVNYYASNSYEADRDEILKVMSPPLRYNEGLGDLLASRETFWAITDSSPLGRPIMDILSDHPGWEPVAPPRTFSDPKPYSFLSFRVTQYAHTGRGAPDRGTIRVHLSGIRPGGHLIARVFSEFEPPPAQIPAFRVQLFSAPRQEVDLSIADLPYGDYVFAVEHDVNDDGQQTWKDGWPAEGVWVLNMENVDRKLGLKGMTFDVLKFSVREPQVASKGTMQYPPFPH